MDKKQQISVWYVLLAVMVLVSIQGFLGGHAETLTEPQLATLRQALPIAAVQSNAPREPS
jgi:uncharacterized membrane protein